MPLIVENMDIVSAHSIHSSVHSLGGGAEMLSDPAGTNLPFPRERPEHPQRSVSQRGPSNSDPRRLPLRFQSAPD
jgi:hypothetical protein